MAGEISTSELGSLPAGVRRRVFAEALRLGKLLVHEPAPAQQRAARRLADELRGAIAGELRFDPGSRALYATDASNYRQAPLGVVLPRSVEDVLAALEVCRRHQAPLLPRGAGTSLAGQCCNAAVVLDFSKYLGRVLELDQRARTARVEPGCVLDTLRAQAWRHGLTFGPDPATHNHCTLGGMLGNNSCGVHSVMAGRTADNVQALEAVTYRGTRLTARPLPDAELRRLLGEGGARGEILRRLLALRDRYAPLIRERFPPIPRRSSGFNLPGLLPESGFDLARALAGTEGTCVTYLEATLMLVPWPRARVLLVLGYPDVFRAADAVPEVLSFGPIGLEGMDRTLFDSMQAKGINPRGADLLHEGEGWLLAEFGGETPEEARAAAEAARRGVGAASARLAEDPEEAHLLWKTRESGLGATAFVPGQQDTWEGWEDSAVAPERLGAYLRELRALMDRFGYRSAFYGHFGEGCLHCRINFDLVSAEGIGRYRAFVEQAADLVVHFGGSFSGEHGDGQSRGELLPRMYGPELVQAFREFKAIFDPDGKMNPGKVIDPYRLDENLRLGASYSPPRVATRFAYPEDEGRFDRAALRCVGVGECRKTEHGTMCPSYMATREERHSTRGRAHLLFEMLDGRELRRGWREPAVREALDLCLACKACKSECPVNVDMATYKAEFLSHHYRGRLRPRAAYAMWLIDLWARLGALAPRLANLVSQTEATAAVARRLAGIAPERAIPAFAPVTFQAWMRGRRAPEGGRPVVLWPDTFTNHFEPDVARLAVEALEGAGARVSVPAQRVCCGRPLYDFGMLGRARRLLQRTLRVLGPALDAGTPVVVLEPSCAAVFRDELPGLLPGDPRGRRLSERTMLLSEYLERHEDAALPRLEREALVQRHCHHQAVLGFDAEARVLAGMGLRARPLDSGCCGMAGSFGFEREKYAVSMAVGERVLLPEVRAASPEALVAADGFSCRQQIAHGTRRRGLHLAELLALAREPKPLPPRPEELPSLRRLARLRPPLTWTGVAARAAALAAGAWLAHRLLRR